METQSINPKNGFNFSLNPSHSENCFLIATAATRCIHENHYITAETNRYQVSDIEMITLKAAYTSLKDLLPTSPTSLSPSTPRKDSWREIPIKDPLLQHAAWAYLQPMEAAAPSDDRNILEKLKGKCCGMFSCFGDILTLVTGGWWTVANDDDGEGEDQVH